MVNQKTYPPILLCFLTTIFALWSFRTDTTAVSFPYEQGGLSKQQAALHLLSRFTYGARPGDAELVLKLGLEKWFEQQLAANFNDDELNESLKQYDALSLTNTEIVQRYKRPGEIRRMAIADGIISKDTVDKKIYKKQLAAYARQNGLRPEKQLAQQLASQKILRSVYSQNQLREVMTEFWFNHFNVSFTKGPCAPFILSYERDAIRPNALGNFEDMLIATAKSPAMLFYLDNATSSGPDTRVGKKDSINRNGRPVKSRGLNENYAREVMELHTLGVDGGYTQKDVTEAARVLTGWTVYPMRGGAYANEIRKRIDSVDEKKLIARGVVREGDFAFIPGRHDKGAKTVMGEQFPPGGGYEEGLQLLQMLAKNSSTADFISRKIAVRFVSDNPPQKLIARMSKTFQETKGDIRQILITMVSSPEFWTADAVLEKTKSPFELIASSLRSLNARITEPQEFFSWLDRMGQKIYFYQAPTGFPDKGQTWISTGSLVNRINFGLALASGNISGVEFDLLQLNNNHEPASTQEALETYCKLMHVTTTDKTIARLAPLLNEPKFFEKVHDAAERTEESNKNQDEELIDEIDAGARKPSESLAEKSDMMKPGSIQLAQVVGIIIGSPEFQRR